MSPDPQIAIQFEAFDVGMKAEVNDLPQQDVDDLVNRAEELLDTGTPLFRAISGFAVAFELAQRNPDELRGIGNDLTSFIKDLGSAE